MVRAWFIGLLGVCAAGGCTASRGELALGSGDPSVKIPAMKKVARERDLASAEQLVKDLDSDDPAVRFFAIGALHRLTGEQYGYNYYDEEEARKPALERWGEWLERQQATRSE